MKDRNYVKMLNPIFSTIKNLQVFYIKVFLRVFSDGA